MAHLVSPGYNHSALINQILPPVAERIIDFRGYNRKSVIEEGEMRDMKNLCADNYPVLSPRKPRGEVSLPDEVIRPLQMIRRFDKLGVIALVTPDPLDPNDHGVAFFYDGVRVTQVTGLTSDSRAVAINNRMCFFPQKTSVDIKNSGVVASTYKSLEASVTMTGVDVVASPTECYVELAGGHNLKYDDAININITSYTPSGGSATVTNSTVSCIVESVEEGVSVDKIHLPVNTFIDVVGAAVTSFTMSGTIKREMPNVPLDHIVEWNNRLWACSSSDNTIYASKLGDPSNWQYFQGTGLDSFYAQQGTDEAWTGIAEYSGHLIFFKPNSMTRVYGTSPSNYQITNTKTYGVEEGSSLSIQTINDTVFYKSAIGIMAYQGGVPVCISENFNREFHKVVSGTEGTKYYASCIFNTTDGTKESALMVFDIAKGLWHKEDELRFTSTCKVADKIYYTTASANILYCGNDVLCGENTIVTSDIVVGDAGIINPDTPTEKYHNIEWMAVFGPFDEYVEEHKIYSKLALLLNFKELSSSVDIYIKTEKYQRLGNEEWEKAGHYGLTDQQWEQLPEWGLDLMDHAHDAIGDVVPIIPRRCERYSVKIVGRGNIEMKSLTRRVRQGTFGRL